MITAQTFRLDGRLALVTGSSAGIGLGLARGLAQAGASIVLNGRDANKLKTTAAALRAEGFDVFERAFDVTDAAAVKSNIDLIEQDIGPIDILINNAGIQRRAPLHEFDHTDWHELMPTNLDRVFFQKGPHHQYLLGAKRVGPPRHFALYGQQRRSQNVDQRHGD